MFEVEIKYFDGGRGFVKFASLKEAKRWIYQNTPDCDIIGISIKKTGEA